MLSTVYQVKSDNLRCQYTNARSMENKQEELEILVQDLIKINKTWWENSHIWNTATEVINCSKRKEIIQMVIYIKNTCFCTDYR